MNVTRREPEAECQAVVDLMSIVGDRWTVRVLVALQKGSRRFNELRRHVTGISQQMLTRTLRQLEGSGLVRRTVHHGSPPAVDYTLTDLGRSLSDTLRTIADWAVVNHAALRTSRRMP